MSPTPGIKTVHPTLLSLPPPWSFPGIEAVHAILLPVRPSCLNHPAWNQVPLFFLQKKRPREIKQNDQFENIKNQKF